MWATWSKRLSADLRRLLGPLHSSRNFERMRFALSLRCLDDCSVPALWHGAKGSSSAHVFLGTPSAQRCGGDCRWDSSKRHQSGAGADCRSFADHLEALAYLLRPLRGGELRLLFRASDPRIDAR